MSHSKPIPEQKEFVVSHRTFEVINHGISGAFAGCLSKVLLYPLGNIEARLQAHAKEEALAHKADTSSKKLESETSDTSNEAKKITVSEIVNQIMEAEGVKGFYKGLVPYVIGTLISSGTYFFWYEFFKGIFIKEGFNALGYSKTAFCAGLISTTITNPINVLHTRILLEKGKSSGMRKTIRKIAKTEGIAGFFKGLLAGYILLINPIIQFIVYEYLKKKFENTKYKALLFFVAGAISKAIATFVTYPYQTIKTNLQANQHGNLDQLELIQKIFREHGIPGFFNGLAPKLFQTVINNALLLMIYEKMHMFISVIVGYLLQKKK